MMRSPINWRILFNDLKTHLHIFVASTMKYLCYQSIKRFQIKQNSLSNKLFGRQMAFVYININYFLKLFMNCVIIPSTCWYFTLHVFFVIMFFLSVLTPFFLLVVWSYYRRTADTSCNAAVVYSFTPDTGQSKLGIYYVA